MSPLRIAALGRDERGFSLIEVMVAAFILIVGVLGTVALVDGSAGATAATKDREGATNLAREVIEASRAVDYFDLTPAAAPGAIQARPGLADSGPGVGWTLDRRSITYTIVATTCSVDHSRDGYGDHSGGDYCSGSSTTGTADGNADDYRRIDVTVTWSSAAGVEQRSRQTGLVINPTGGLGPLVKKLCLTSVAGATGGTTCPATELVQISSSSVNTAPFHVLTGAADAVRWRVNSPGAEGNATKAPASSVTSWTFDWDLKPIQPYTCGDLPDWVLDGSYSAEAQGFDSVGIPGQPSSVTVTINRSSPFKTCNLEGGYNDPPAAGPIPDRPAIVDLQWHANPERDIVRYHVYRDPVGSETAPQLICDTTDSSCWDANPVDAATYPTVQYFVVAVDLAPGGGLRSGDLVAATRFSVAQTGNNPPNQPATLTSGGVVAGLPVIDWTAASPEDPDSGDTLSFYRIYRDGVSYTDRYDRTNTAASFSYTDSAPGAGGHDYYVSAVDQDFNESAPVGPVRP